MKSSLLLACTLALTFSAVAIAQTQSSIEEIARAGSTARWSTVAPRNQPTRRAQVDDPSITFSSPTTAALMLPGGRVVPIEPAPFQQCVRFGHSRCLTQRGPKCPRRRRRSRRARARIFLRAGLEGT